MGPPVGAEVMQAATKARNNDHYRGGNDPLSVPVGKVPSRSSRKLVGTVGLRPLGRLEAPVCEQDAGGPARISLCDNTPNRASKTGAGCSSDALSLRWVPQHGTGSD
ncbi:hypothetical protein GCM10010289_39440 [Streptomyces violascens]|uniref:Uncharacterized protein n=1 Tax=Streptomyces violascens TaxID=67381 RepID=A0ABQ3QXJ4_9ACTN|nr:hypothetical protein GCM10010289_39440 [Streptomyces violascens]GHI41994.1 hypothetical protein Sviol_64020 [Streptomyces violascens]